MSVRTSSSTEKPQIGVPAIMIAFAIIAVLIGGLAFHYFGSQRVSSHNSGSASTDQQWINQKAKESGGNFDRLSLVDKQKLWQIGGGGQSPLRLQMAYQQLSDK